MNTKTDKAHKVTLTRTVYAPDAGEAEAVFWEIAKALNVEKCNLRNLMLDGVTVSAEPSDDEARLVELEQLIADEYIGDWVAAAEGVLTKEDYKEYMQLRKTYID